jgi:hypothetical protein
MKFGILLCTVNNHQSNVMTSPCLEEEEEYQPSPAESEEKFFSKKRFFVTAGLAMCASDNLPFLEKSEDESRNHILDSWRCTASKNSRRR